ncbi:helix-turn-helix transcriptional regulator [Paenibacillus alginolyticus]|uniref:Helix-turn-helix transcriptional regulator n=1 Tax=Paenibacillus alginolyticus TaxID=59839 RepID=A0ABT4GKX5_9BACL|nr:helix-turn-helix transcriptional regulator [Paenibacillus alginolyticus]MCY9668956.1 helix-turn-helix transcriptional regulator [Paenibacillus alginolyticus]MCY9696838.1 helix-turn-helix transcriptional regulator [Paenibacillus alginolyticus]MEC0147648.1 helix-turn-helix transcriptional regulator [Paenibacillus alginolyticus]
MEMIDLVKKHAPITGERIAELLGISRPTIRSDLAVLVMLRYIDAKPKVGYFLGTAALEVDSPFKHIEAVKVKDVMGIPIVLRETATVSDAVVTLFLENVGSLIVVNMQGVLAGIVTRKDLLKVTLGQATANTMPVSLVMTRHPNVVTVNPEDSVLEAARKMIHHQVDGLPVVKSEADQEPDEVVGRITKTTMTKLLLDVALGT